LAEGDGFTLGADATQPASNYSPGVPLLAGGLYALSGGPHERLARMVLGLLGSLAILFAYLIGRRLAGPAAGLVGAAAVAIYPALVEYQGMLMGEPLAATLLSGAVLTMLWAADSGSGGGRAKWLVPGFLLGALVLVRPEYLGISVLLAVVVLAWGREEWRSGAVNGAILLAGVALVVAPWTVRNAVMLDRFVPVSTGGGQVLFAGSYVPSGGDPERVGEEVLERHPGLGGRLPPDARLEQILAALAEQRYPGMETDEALGRMGRERLWDDVRERPVEYGGFVAAKVWRAWSQGPRNVMEQPGWRAFHLALVVLAWAGLALLVRRRQPEALLFVVLLLAVTAIAALLVASPRRVLVALPLLAALAGVGCAGVRRRDGEPLEVELTAARR
ncbi:MAG TPA: glycosyltransferase family 39 protein, partial [Solirubrobacterales bacterium]